MNLLCKCSARCYLWACFWEAFWIHVSNSRSLQKFTGPLWIFPCSDNSYGFWQNCSLKKFLEYWIRYNSFTIFLFWGKKEGFGTHGIWAWFPFQPQSPCMLVDEWLHPCFSQLSHLQTGDPNDPLFCERALVLHLNSLSSARGSNCVISVQGSDLQHALSGVTHELKMFLVHRLAPSMVEGKKSTENIYLLRHLSLLARLFLQVVFWIYF